jgi:hypothetical protein
MASIVDYQESLRLSKYDPSFSALLFALIRKADTDNLEKITKEWPELLDEFKLRYKSFGGALDEDELQYLQAQEG